MSLSILLYALLSSANAAFLDEEFLKARGFAALELAALYVQRIDCTQRVYTPDGFALEGTAAIRMTQVTNRFYDFNFESFVNLSNFNQGIVNNDITPATQRQLLNIADWREGKPLKIRRNLWIEPNDEQAERRAIQIIDEFRVLEDTVPKTIIVKESVEGRHYYFICQ